MEDVKGMITELLKKYASVFDQFPMLRVITQEEIKEYEERLRFKLPEELVWFLITFKESKYFIKSLSIVEETLKIRYHLPEQFLVLNNHGDYVVCMNAKTGSIITCVIGPFDSLRLTKSFDHLYFYILDKILILLEKEVVGFYDQEWEKSLLNFVNSKRKSEKYFLSEDVMEKKTLKEDYKKGKVSIRILSKENLTSIVSILRKYYDISIAEIKTRLEENRDIAVEDYTSTGGIQKILLIYQELIQNGISCQLYENDSYVKEELLKNLLQSYLEDEKISKEIRELETTERQVPKEDVQPKKTIGLKIGTLKNSMIMHSIIRGYYPLSDEEINGCMKQNEYIALEDYYQENGVKNLLTLYKDLKTSGIACQLYVDDHLPSEESIQELFEIHSNLGVKLEDIIKRNDEGKNTSRDGTLGKYFSNEKNQYTNKGKEKQGNALWKKKLTGMEVLVIVVLIVIIFWFFPVDGKFALFYPFIMFCLFLGMFLWTGSLVLRSFQEKNYKKLLLGMILVLGFGIFSLIYGKNIILDFVEGPKKEILYYCDVSIQSDSSRPGRISFGYYKLSGELSDSSKKVTFKIGHHNYTNLLDQCNGTNSPSYEVTYYQHTFGLVEITERD